MGFGGVIGRTLRKQHAVVGVIVVASFAPKSRVAPCGGIRSVGSDKDSNSTTCPVEGHIWRHTGVNLFLRHSMHGIHAYLTPFQVSHLPESRAEAARTSMVSSSTDAVSVAERTRDLRLLNRSSSHVSHFSRGSRSLRSKMGPG